MLCGTTLIAVRTDDHLAHRHGVLNACPVTGAEPFQTTEPMACSPKLLADDVHISSTAALHQTAAL